jgi:hypothetical protein
MPLTDATSTETISKDTSGFFLDECKQTLT